jgi:hypothetical protein
VDRVALLRQSLARQESLQETFNDLAILNPHLWNFEVLCDRLR